MNLEALKTMVDRIGRKRISEATGIKYGTLTPKLNGINPLTGREEELIWEAAEKFEKEDALAVEKTVDNAVRSDSGELGNSGGVGQDIREEEQK